MHDHDADNPSPPIESAPRMPTGRENTDAVERRMDEAGDVINDLLREIDALSVGDDAAADPVPDGSIANAVEQLAEAPPPSKTHEQPAAARAESPSEPDPVATLGEPPAEPVVSRPDEGVVFEAGVDAAGPDDIELERFDPAKENVDADAETSGATGAASVTPPDALRVPDEELRRMDHNLADDLEDLLHGNFDTVSKILEDEGETAEPAPRTTADAAREVGAADSVVSELIPPGMIESEPLPDREPGLSPPPKPEPEPEAVEPEAVEPGPIVEPVLVAASRSTEWPAWLVMIEAIVVAALRVINRPLRSVPAPARPIVDWIALSLVFWVPIVWVVALLLVR